MPSKNDVENNNGNTEKLLPKELNKITKEIRHISKYATRLTDETKKDILDIMYAVLRNQKTMIKLIDEKLDLDVWKEINHNKIEELEEK